MENIFTSGEGTAKLKQLQQLCDAAGTIAILGHTNPDGDAVGSGLALWGFLKARGYDARFFLPNHFPKFLHCIPGTENAEVYIDNQCQPRCDARDYVSKAGLVICVDFNQIRRLEKLAEAVEANTTAPRVLIDHHLDPPPYTLNFADTSYSSTAHIVCDLIAAWSSPEAITPGIATALYVGMSTDTGNFSYGNLTPELYRTVAMLVERGTDPVDVSKHIFGTQTEHRLRLVGYLISEKMTVREAEHTAWITLSRDEKHRFHHQIGDTEGIVNMPLSIDTVAFSAIFIETLEHIKISFRSQGDFDVNLFAREHFNGGGHRNASGGRFFGTMTEAVALFEKIIKEQHP